jgi:O-antigen/teichoic acid export membrane protein
LKNIYHKILSPSLINNKDVKKSIVLYCAMVAGIGLGFAVSIINTRYLSVVDFGKLKFIQQLFFVIANITSFGFSYSAGRLITQVNYITGQHLTGATVIIHVIIAFLTSCGVFILSFYFDNLFGTHISYYLRLVTPFVFVGIFTQMIENLLQGLSRIYSLALFRTIPHLFYVVSSALLIITFHEFSLSTALLLNYGITGLIISLFVLVLKPKFIQFKYRVKEIWQENKTNGLHVYTGSLCNVAVGNLVGVALGYYVDMESVGYYSLALIVSAPLQFLPSVIGTTLFKDFATQRRIQPAAILSTILPTIASLIIFLLLIKHIILFAYSEKYMSVVPYAYILAIGMILHGIGDFFNRFLGAHARGKELRNVAIFSGLILLFGSILLMPKYGVLGAVWIKTGSSCVYLLGVIIYYLKLVRHNVFCENQSCKR